MPRFNSNAPVMLNVTIAVPGTAEQLASHFIPDGLSVVIKADIENDGNIYWGYTQAGAQGTARETLVSGQDSAPLYIDDLSRIWMDAENATDTAEINIMKAG